jgi:hypothetical protein
MILSQIRSAENSTVFIERTYRKRDPKYADFSLRQQWEILARLYEEWYRSECKEPVAPPLQRKQKESGTRWHGDRETRSR